KSGLFSGSYRKRFIPARSTRRNLSRFVPCRCRWHYSSAHLKNCFVFASKIPTLPSFVLRGISFAAPTCAPEVPVGACTVCPLDCPVRSGGSAVSGRLFL